MRESAKLDDTCLIHVYNLIKFYLNIYFILIYFILVLLIYLFSIFRRIVIMYYSDFIINFKVVLPCYNNSWSLGSFRRTRRATKEQNLMDFPTSEYNVRKINVQKCTFNSSIPLYPHPMGACYYLKVPFNG